MNNIYSKNISKDFSSDEDHDLKTFLKTKYESDSDLSFISNLANNKFQNYKIVSDYFKKNFNEQNHPHEIKNIALYVHKLYNGGSEKVNALLSKLFSLEKNGKRYKVIIVTEIEPSSQDYEIPSGTIRVVIPPFNQPKNNYELRGKALIQLIEDYDIDAFISSDWTNPDILWDLLTIKSSSREPAFYIHTHSFCSVVWKLRNNISKATWNIYSLADGVITLSETDQIYWINVNPNTYKLYNPADQSINHIKNKWKESPHHIIWVGRISPEKQPFEMVKIMKNVKNIIPDIICHMIGGEDEQLSNNLKKYIKENNLSDNIILEGFTSDVDSFYEIADVFVSTSEFEGFPLAYMESASYGIPTVVYDIPWLEYNKFMTGIERVPQLDSEQAANRIISILTDRDKWETNSQLIYESYKKYKNHDFRSDWDEIFSNFERGIVPQNKVRNRNFAIILEELMNSVNTPEKKMQQELDAVYNSASWKIGQMIVNPLHELIRRIIKMKNKI